MMSIKFALTFLMCGGTLALAKLNSNSLRHDLTRVKRAFLPSSLAGPALRQKFEDEDVQSIILDLVKDLVSDEELHEFEEALGIRTGNIKNLLQGQVDSLLDALETVLRQIRKSNNGQKGSSVDSVKIVENERPPSVLEMSKALVQKTLKDAVLNMDKMGKSAIRAGESLVNSGPSLGNVIPGLGLNILDNPFGKKEQPLEEFANGVKSVLDPFGLMRNLQR